MNTFTSVAPFSTKTSVVITAPVPASVMVEQLDLPINLKTGTASLKKRDALLFAAQKLVGSRLANESAESWASRAQAALNKAFAA